MKVFNIDLVSVSSCAQVSALADGAVSAAVEFIARSLGEKPTIEAYNALRVEWRGAYMTQRGLDAADKRTACTLDMAWSRNVLLPLQVEYSFAVPKSTSKAAVDKAAKRAKPEAVDKAQSVTELEAIAMPVDAIEAAKLQAQISAKKVSLLKAERLVAEKAKSEALKARGESLIGFIRECVKTGNAVILAELEAMRDHDATMVLTALPLVEIQKAMPKLIELASSAPKKAQKPRKAKIEDALM